MSSDALKLFWPSHICTPNNRRGFLIGWYNSHNTICVATVIQNVELHDLQTILSEFCRSGNHSEFSHINKVCKVPPKILGVMLDAKEKSKRVETNGHDPWITVNLDDAYVPVPLTRFHRGKPELIELYEIIFYDQPNPKRLQFLSHDPLELDISAKEISESRPDGPLLTPANKHPTTIANIEKIIEYSHIHTGCTTQVSDDLVSVLVQVKMRMSWGDLQINSSYYLEIGIEASRAKQLRQSKQPDSFGWIWTVSESFASHLIHVWMIGTIRKIFQTIKTLIVGPILCVSFVLLLVAEIFLYSLNVRLPKGLLNTVAIKDLSAAGQQVDLRLQQLYFWPRQYMMLRERNRANTAETRAYYISFYNSMWLVANDIIIGLAIGSFLMSNSYSAAKVLHGALNKYTVESLQSMMLWFLESPAGLKLNHELGSFLNCVQLIEPYTPQIVHLIGLSGVFGVSMIISLSSDFLAFMTLHVYCFHMVAARIFNWQLLILHSLFNLFRGKKRNTLRNRIDSCDYALDQLLLGTCLFTLLTFLFPTVLIYYLTFAVGRVGVIFLQAVMETLLAFFNHFPLFAIMLRAKDPDRLPGGLQFDIFDHNNFLKKHHPLYYRLKNLKIGCQKLWSTFWETKGKKPVITPAPSASRYTKSGRSLGQRTRRRISVGSSSSSSSAAAAVSRAKAKKSQIQLDKTDSRRGTYLRMRNMPIPFGAIFFQYMLLWKRLSVHYFSVYVFKCLLCGEPIKPIPKLQPYSSIQCYRTKEYEQLLRVRIKEKKASSREIFLYLFVHALQYESGCVNVGVRVGVGVDEWDISKQQ
ncbi:hypothetical protein PHYBLDRAFT_79399 [Phycomyces blakesleeanus NRRL 1555(-)]|uniref:Uncharacterized protein n=1 Tax=Phycomyces blakesleeanus (strain ATCC 8743b / DSM 1359 / FGSC 10004 / NBRC 33097 / NRRL 1555) TaxID=763407 RepID=A0A162TLP7_PHYB8|nr:hypothetical protein PHYBLDRAFT_79399 [Phycomyces blakesleeanus NRRL 1555(-)]OAD68133.1 hypothetical protein PHYBLDRAFT_79399 [Phycomyces blakesleeanus NRRL 1555(-)]|eukprot:XP_018286173.1 hypothetical protein PHYBLDRAFT_79399 [Phycomyces blakesleeanus NRRL 1555(-)]